MSDHKIHLLIVEDNPADLSWVRGLLAGAPALQVTWEHVEGLSTARDRLRREPFDLVLLDLSLPDSQGLDTFRSLHPHAICLPIIVLASINDEPLALQAVQAGAQDYLVKGQAAGDHVVRTLRHAIKRKQVETSLRVKIRELTVLAQQLEQAGRIGYELNNSLALIILSVEALIAQIPPDDLKHRDLRIVHDEISRMGRQVANLLQFSHQSGSPIWKAELPEQIKNTPDLIEHLQAHQIVTIQDGGTYFFQSSEPGTAGYILTGAAVNELVAMIHHLIREGVQIPRTLGSRLLGDYLEQIKTEGVPGYEELSTREREVLRLIGRGRTNKEIAKRLAVSVRTVERHRSSIMNKLGLQNRAELVAYAVQQGLLSGEEKE
ncbi:MAG TPA: LuxR C-terminal-related transcriptional regulator [Anaerolineales bacterium]|nr:LuxR C-terminal-related transcriptional regulator [Anaerolineales bacterium]